jgi:genome maintenance exonuclease 1
MHQKTFNHNFLNVGSDITSSETESGRMYITEDGQFPSVTTITSWEKQEFFKIWRKQNPEESKRVTARGNRLHSIIECYLNNEDLSKKEIMPNDMDLFIQIKAELDKIDNIKALETPLYGKNVGLAGRVDCIAEYDGVLSIIDFKGSTRQKRKEDIDNYMMQATAYALLWKEMTGQTIENFVILISCEDGAVQVFKDTPINHVANLFNAIKKYKEAKCSTKTM